MSGRRKWSKDDVVVLKRMVADGASLEDMSAELGRTMASVRSKMSDECLTFGSGKPKEYSVEEKKAILLMRSENIPFKEIAESLGRTEKAVKEHVVKLRLEGLKEEPTPTTPRECLRCRTTFASEGAHNRLCNPCREVARTSPWSAYGVGGEASPSKLGFM